MDKKYGKTVVNITFSTDEQTTNDIYKALDTYFISHIDYQKNETLDVFGRLARYTIERTIDFITVTQVKKAPVSLCDELYNSCVPTLAAQLLGVSEEVISYLVFLGKLDVATGTIRITNESIDRCWREKLAGKLLSH